MKKIHLLIITLFLATGLFAQQTNPQNQANTKLWNEKDVSDFNNYMQGAILKIVGDGDFHSGYINQWVETIVDEAQRKLKSYKKTNYKYIADVIILPRARGYKKNTGFWWQPKTDKAITIKVDTEHLHCLLVVYCVRI